MLLTHGVQKGANTPYTLTKSFAHVGKPETTS